MTCAHVPRRHEVGRSRRAHAAHEGQAFLRVRHVQLLSSHPYQADRYMIRGPSNGPAVGKSESQNL